jgi:hypothetical protein
MRVSDKNIDVDAAEAIFSDAPSLFPLLLLDPRNGELATNGETENIRGGCPGREGVLSESRRG